MRKAWWLGGAGVLVVAARWAPPRCAGVGFGAKAGRQGRARRSNSPRARWCSRCWPACRCGSSSPARWWRRTAPWCAPRRPARCWRWRWARAAACAPGSRSGSIDLADLGSRVAERQATVESARAQFAQAERAHASNQRLADQQFISPNALDASRAALDAARAGLDAAQAQLDTARARPARGGAGGADRRRRRQAPRACPARS